MELNNKIATILTSGFADWEYALIAGVGRSFYGLDVQFFTPEAGDVQSQGALLRWWHRSWNLWWNIGPCSGWTSE